jgi:hypothetical protein
VFGKLRVYWLEQVENRERRAVEVQVTVDGLKRLKVWVKAKDFALKIYQELLPLVPAE